MAEFRTFYPTNSLSGIDLIFSGKESCPQGHSYGPAIRNHYLIHHIIEGKGRYRLAGHTYDLGPGDNFLISPGDLTYYEASMKEPWTYLWAAFDGTDCEKLLAHSGLSRTNPTAPSQDPQLTSAKLHDLVFSTMDEMKNPLLRLAKLSDFLRTLQQGHIVIEQETTAIENALTFIHNNYAYPIKIEEIAKAIHMERSWFYRSFKDSMGLSPKDYLTNYRLTIAKQMLLKDHYSITEIALSCGFTTTSAFHKHFRNHYGITPKTFRTAQIHYKSQL